jgi:hypothetical protein
MKTGTNDYKNLFESILYRQVNIECRSLSITPKRERSSYQCFIKVQYKGWFVFVELAGSWQQIVVIMTQ